MRVVIDVEANSLTPTKIWLIVAKDIDTNQYHIFRNVTEDVKEAERFKEFYSKIDLFIGHNVLGFDYPVLLSLLNLNELEIHKFIDTLIISRLVDYPRKGHSVADYGVEFGIEKKEWTDWSKYSKDMEDYCIRDVDITHKIYLKYLKYINKEERKNSILLEHMFQYYVVNSLSTNGFYINNTKLTKLLDKVTEELSIVDKNIHSTYPSRLKLIREVIPKATKYNTISLSSIPKVLRENIHEYTIGAPFSYCKWEAFNPSSHKQIIEILNQAGWKPEDKTETHKDLEREYNKLKHSRVSNSELDLRKSFLHNRLQELRKSGWKVNENNLETLPSTSPPSAKSLAHRILLEARRRTLTEWLNLIQYEIKIDEESINVFGLYVKEALTQSGVPRNRNIIEKDIEKEILSWLENLTYTTEEFIPKKKENVSTILNLPTDFLSKILINFLKLKKVNVSCVIKQQNCLWITATAQEKSEVFFANPVIQCLDGLKNVGIKYSIISTRIKGDFIGIGAWTHRMAHRSPNTANIPNEFDTQGKKKLYGKELRSLWSAPKNRLLVGCDAEGIQLRIFAHYINDPEFTQALVNGKKEDKSDPHSLNQSILGSVCKSRAAAKRYIYALLLGAGSGKLREILDCDEQSANDAYQRLLERYTGYAELKETIIPSDAKRGWFVGLDGRAVRIPGESVSSRRHLAMSGYLQNGEAVVMKIATLKWVAKLKDYNAKLVNFVHDEWQVECPNNVAIAIEIGQMMSDSLRVVGEELELKCPLAGSIWNDDLKDYTIGTNWSVTH